MDGLSDRFLIMGKDFDLFLETQKREARSAIDFADVKAEWLDSIRDLYAQLTAFMGDYVAEGSVEISRQPSYITEESFGSYATEELIIALGNKRVLIQPVARLVIGSLGRVDILGISGRSRFVRLNESVTADNLASVHVRVIGRSVTEPRLKSSARRPDAIVWRLVAPPPRLEFLPLTQDRFLSTLVQVSGGQA